MESNLQKYAAFVKAVEYGSFSKAAEALHYSQSGVSRMIADLENEFQLKLLDRDRGGVTLTSDGARLLPRAQGLLREFNKLQTTLNEIRGLETGLIRIGTFASVAEHWLPNMISQFTRDYPRIDYELVYGDYYEIERWIQEGLLDKPLCRDIALVLKCRNRAPLAVQRFLTYLPYRNKQEIR